MAVIDQEITNNYSLYNGDCMEVLPSLKSDSIHFSVYSPPFCGLYNYSSQKEDFSNCRSYEEFFQQYEFLVSEKERVTIPGRCSMVHCMDVPESCNSGSNLRDFPGDIIRLHQKLGFKYRGRYHIWKEPLAVRNRTMAKGLAHKQIVEDAVQCDMASADYLLVFQKKGENPIPVTNPTGLHKYAGSQIMPAENQSYKGWKGKQTGNRYSHWIWRQYASSHWMDIRGDRVIPFNPKEAREEDDEKHVHPLQLDVIERAVTLRSNPGEVVLTPFYGSW